MLSWKETRTPVDNPSRRQTSHIRQHHESREIVRFTAKTVCHPGTHARKSGKRLPGVHHEIPRPVQRGLALHRVDKRHVIDAGRELRQQVAHPEARLTVLAKFPEALLAIARL